MDSYCSISKTFMCLKSKEMLVLLYWPSELTNPVTYHAVVLHDCGALAPKAITKQPFFFKMVTFVIYIFLLKWKLFS